MDIDRYRIAYSGNGIANMALHETGGYVTLDDHARALVDLQAERDELLKACMTADNVQDALDVISSLKQVQTNFNDELVLLEKERDELRAANDELQAALEKCRDEFTIQQVYELRLTDFDALMKQCGLLLAVPGSADFDDEWDEVQHVWRWSAAAEGE